MFIINKVKPIAPEFISEGLFKQLVSGESTPIVYTHFMYTKRRILHMDLGLKTVDIQGRRAVAKLMRPYGEKLSLYGQSVNSVPVNLHRSQELIRCL